MKPPNTPLAAALLMSVIPANAVELSCAQSAVQLEQKATKNEPYVIQRLYPAVRVKSDCARAIQIAAQGDEAAMDKMIEQDRITFFAVGTRLARQIMFRNKIPTVGVLLLLPISPDDIYLKDLDGRTYRGPSRRASGLVGLRRLL